ncbi:MAG: HNH endonuclease [Aureliella sp.]
MNPVHQNLLKKLATLRVDRSKGVAPHKPLLLLVILELEKLGQLEKPVLELTPELAFRFSVYWSIVAHRRTQPPDVRLPFHHTRTSKLWTTLKADGSESKNRDFTTAIRLSDDFLEALESPDFREAAAQTLITNYFEDEEQIALYEMSGTPQPTDSDFLHDLVSESKEQFRAAGRSARFRVDVVAAYCHTCALTGYRITTVTGHSIVDAAHIHQFAKSRNDDPQNGIALCKNAHWLFDLGLWSIDENYCVIVAKQAFSEECPHQESLSEMNGRLLRLPVYEHLWPSPKNLRWHRETVFGKLC